MGPEHLEVAPHARLGVVPVDEGEVDRRVLAHQLRELVRAAVHLCEDHLRPIPIVEDRRPGQVDRYRLAQAEAAQDLDCDGEGAPAFDPDLEVGADVGERHRREVGPELVGELERLDAAAHPAAEVHREESRRRVGRQPHGWQQVVGQDVWVPEAVERLARDAL
jgi:hypothetical protein